MSNIVYLPTFPENPGNPARVHVPTGQIEINSMVWDILTPEQQDFVLQHELGHYRLQTYDETVADRYALQQLALKKPNSLWNYVTSVREISHNNPQRVYQAEKGALSVAAAQGSKQAQSLLKTHYANADGSKQRGIVTILFISVIIALTTILLINKK